MMHDSLLNFHSVFIDALCENPSLVLKVPSCKTSAFQLSFFNRIVPLWNRVCKIACPAVLRSLTMFKSFLSRTYVQLLENTYNVDMPCTWSLCRIVVRVIGLNLTNSF
jgi:hypothetical protein